MRDVQRFSAGPTNGVSTSADKVLDADQTGMLATRAGRQGTNPQLTLEPSNRPSSGLCILEAGFPNPNILLRVNPNTEVRFQRKRQDLHA